ncbi:hypothetical protein EON76_04565 [bacterium]|nr:MAG: hypothetical protein EON76_04565 [bacterium]
MALSLTKGSTAESLVNASGVPVTKLTVGVGWDKSSRGKKGLAGWASKRKGIDLDLSVLVYDNNGAGVRVCGFDTPVLFQGSLRHTGDNKTGKGDGIDESIEIDLSSMQPNITGLVVCLNAFKDGVTFADIAGADCFFSEGFGGDQHGLGMFSVPIDKPDKSTVFMARLVKGDGGDWTISVVNQMDDLPADSVTGMLSAGKRFLTA